MNYIGHNQWDGQNFPVFYNNVINKQWDKIILFCQNEWEWQAHDPVYFPLLLEHCKKINQKIDVIAGSCSHMYPLHRIDPIIIEQTNVFYWDTYWLGKTYKSLIDVGLSPIIDPYLDCLYDYHFICMNHRPHRHRLLLIDLLAKENLLDNNAISIHMENPQNYTWRYYNFKPRHLEIQYLQDFQNYRVPEQYYKSFCQLVSESSSCTNILSEKTATPLIIGKPFLVSGHVQFHKVLKNLGFELYDEIFDYSFDNVEDMETRFELIVKNFVDLAKVPLQELNTLQKKIAPKIEHNQNKAREIIFDLKIYPQIAIDIIQHYKETGYAIDQRLVDNHLALEAYRDVKF